ncbi:MAG: hypothetical protein ACKV2V_17755 [Blastocatellia bacterium]
MFRMRIRTSRAATRYQAGHWSHVSVAILFLLLAGEAAARPGSDDKNESGPLPETTAPVPASPSASIYRPGLRNSPAENSLSAKELDVLLTSLRDKTGFSGLQLDEAGFLILEDETVSSGGSEWARNLVLAALHGHKSISLQSHNRSSTVAFARTSSPTMYRSMAAGTRIELHPIEIDFADFRALQGDREAVRAFDPGIVVLHELCHIVLNLRDPESSRSLAGDCEDYVNRIRLDLGMPVRETYQARLRTAQPAMGSATTRVAELVFAQQGQPGQKGSPKWFYLQWDPTRVGGTR